MRAEMSESKSGGRNNKSLTLEWMNNNRNSSVKYDILSGVINGRYVVHSNTHVQNKIQVARATVQFGCDYVTIYVDNLIGHNLPSV